MIELLFFKADADTDGRLSLRDFSQSGFLENLEQLDERNQCSEQFNFFSYDYFYVICCIFNELDVDENGLIGRQEIEHYCRHSISVLTLDRLFAGAAMPLSGKGEQPQMTYEDFVRFILVEEDKGSSTAIHFWFRLLDLDGDGALTLFHKLVRD